MSTQPPRAGGSPPGILTLHIKDKSALYVAYMPFVKNGGLFIPTNKDYHLGDDIFMLLTLMDNPERLPVAGKRSEEHTSELQSLMRISYAVFCLKKKKNHTRLQFHRYLHKQS